jgi:hypothetical protein
VLHTCDPSTQEAEEEDCKLEASWGYTERFNTYALTSLLIQLPYGSSVVLEPHKHKICLLPKMQFFPLTSTAAEKCASFNSETVLQIFDH